MNTAFFNHLFQFMDGVDMTINLKRKGDKLAFSIIPKPRVDDSAKDSIKPIAGIATPEEMDNDLIDQITPAIEAVSKWTLNIQAFEENMKQVAAIDVKAKKDKEELTKTKEKAKKLFDEAKKLHEDGEYQPALQKINKSLATFMDSQEAKDLKAEITEKIGGTLF